MRARSGLPVTVILVIVLAAAHSDAKAQELYRSQRLTLEEQIEFARSAAPPHIADSADVYALGDSGFVKAVAGTSGFACIVERPDPRFRWPICYDPEGVRTMIPVALYRARLRAAGVAEKAVTDSIAAGYLSGRFQPPARNGLAYMLSRHGYVVDAAADSIIPLGPHLMFYSPYMTDAEIGGALPEMEIDPRFPFVMADGKPNAYIIVRLPDFDTGR